MGELRESKKRATRQRLSDIATELFYARGFDAVTVEDIAAAANVSKVTVFNYFPRKEDLFFDRQDEVKQLLQQALTPAAKAPGAVDAIRGLVDRLREQKHPFARIDAQTVGFFRIVAASQALKARLREIEDEAVDALAAELGGPRPDGPARLIAGMIVLTWRTAYEQAIRVIEAGGSTRKANAAFIALIERGFTSIRPLAAGARAKG